MRGVEFSTLLVASLANPSCTTAVRSGEQPAMTAAVAQVKAAGLQLVTEHDLQRLIIGHAVGSTLLTSQHVEQYLPSGEYRVLGHRNAAAAGRYYIGGNRVCTKLPTSLEMCKIFGSDAQGRYFVRGIGYEYGAPELVVITKL